MRFIITLLFMAAYTFAITGLELAELLESREKPNDIKSINTMTLTNKDGKTKILELVSMSKDDSKKQMIWFLEPKDDYGVSFLKIENSDGDDFMNMWLPGFNKFRRISSQKKTDSFMGSDLSFEDMTNREIDEYIYRTLEIDIKCNDYTEDFNENRSIPSYTYRYYENGQLELETDCCIPCNSLINSCTGKIYYENGQLKSEMEFVLDGGKQWVKCWDKNGDEIECEYLMLNLY